MKIIKTVRDATSLILGKAKKLGCCGLYIETAYKKKVAHKMYESLGFKNYGCHFYKNL